MSSTGLKRMYEMCAGSYIKIIQSWSDNTRGVERMALDGIRFLLMCRILGISTDRLDPVLARYQQHLVMELERLHCSLESFDGSAVHPKEEFV